MQPQKKNGIIALYLPTLAGGGAEKVTLNLIAGLVSAGRQVDFILGDRSGPFANSVPAGCNLYDLGGIPPKRCIVPLARYLRKVRPRAIISQMFPTNVSVILGAMLSRTRCPVICVEHCAPEMDSTNHGWRRWMATVTYPRAARIVAVSRGTVGSIASHYRLRSSNIEVIYNGIVDDQLNQKAIEPVAHPWLAEGNVVPVFVAAGRLQPQKGFNYLLEAMALVTKQREARLIILGEGELLGSLKAQADQLGIRSHVDFAGFQSNPYPYFRAANCFVLSSLFEGLPTVLIEALACGCPVVATDCPSGPAEILNRAGLGLLVPVADPVVLGRSMCESLEFPFERQNLRNRAADFLIGTCARNYLRLIDSL